MKFLLLLFLIGCGIVNEETVTIKNDFNCYSFTKYGKFLMIEFEPGYKITCDRSEKICHVFSRPSTIHFKETYIRVNCPQTVKMRTRVYKDLKNLGVIEKLRR